MKHCVFGRDCTGFDDLMKAKRQAKRLVILAAVGWSLLAAKLLLSI